MCYQKLYFQCRVSAVFSEFLGNFTVFYAFVNRMFPIALNTKRIYDRNRQVGFVTFFCKFRISIVAKTSFTEWVQPSFPTEWRKASSVYCQQENISRTLEIEPHANLLDWGRRQQLLNVRLLPPADYDTSQAFFLGGLVCLLIALYAFMTIDSDWWRKDELFHCSRRGHNE